MDALNVDLIKDQKARIRVDQGEDLRDLVDQDFADQVVDVLALPRVASCLPS